MRFCRLDVYKRQTQGSLPEDLPLADRRNMVYSGSLVTYGRAQVLVTGTGMHTEIGKIAGMMNDIRDRKTPLQVSLDQFSSCLLYTSRCV